LQISAGDARILLTGDIERSAEYRLLDNSALQSITLLLAPHHGSRSSSTAALIERVHPEYVVFSTGYLNRFKHPNTAVVQRYQDSGAKLFDTAFTGALTFTFAQGRAVQIAAQRSQLQHYWD
jgi:competence protein ComEC